MNASIERELIDELERVFLLHGTSHLMRGQLEEAGFSDPQTLAVRGILRKNGKGEFTRGWVEKRK